MNIFFKKEIKENGLARKGEQQIHVEVVTLMIAVFAVALLLISTMIARANVQTDCTSRLWFPLFLAALGSLILIKRWLVCKSMFFSVINIAYLAVIILTKYDDRNVVLRKKRITSKLLGRLNRRQKGSNES